MASVYSSIKVSILSSFIFKNLNNLNFTKYATNLWHHLLIFGVFRIAKKAIINVNRFTPNPSTTKGITVFKSYCNLLIFKNINIAIDLHRDGRDLKTDADIQKEHERMSTTYKGEKVAKFFFVVGMRNPNVNEVKSLAEDITKFAKTKYRELVLSVVEKPVGKFNQYMAQNHMLIEVGSNGTSSEEAKASAKYIAEILDEYFKQNR